MSQAAAVNNHIRPPFPQGISYYYSVLNDFMIGEAFQIAPHDDNAEGHGNDEAHQHNLHEARVEHRQDLLHRCTMHATDANLLAAVLRLEHHQAEHAHQRDDDGQNREQIDQLRKILLLFILPLNSQIEWPHPNRETVA